ncbi:MAG: methyltransferase domain-containing protein [Clostridiales bacterium]|nr:methyltransferase domain-containing protein [Clostridiales bacterium]
MKLSVLATKLEPMLRIMQCPVCASPFLCDGQSLRCTQNHCFDLSAKGYVNLAPSHVQSKEKYDQALFESRRQVFEDGFYTPVVSCIHSMLQNRFADQSFSLLDVGCGEGYYARELSKQLPNTKILGVDLSRDAIMAAARTASTANFLVANLKQLPIASSSIDLVLDVLTPADYTEFRRVLSPDGELIKVVPGNEYLKEVREAVSGHLRNDSYDNSQVVSHLEAQMQIIERKVIHHTMPLSPVQAKHFLKMTPMTFSISDEELALHSPAAITIHMEVLRCRAKS